MTGQGSVFRQRQLDALVRPRQTPQQTEATRTIQRQRRKTQSFIHANPLFIQNNF
jgi:hypothetical protein